MSATNIKDGAAYVRVGVRDDTKPGFDKVDSGFRAFSKSIQRHSELTQATVAAAAAKSAAAAVRDLKAQQREVELLAKAAKKEADGTYKQFKKADNSTVSSHDVASRYAIHGRLAKEIANYEDRITAALSQQATLEQAAAAALATQDRRAANRLSQAKAHTAELERQQQLAARDATGGTAAVKTALMAGSTQNRITTLGSTAEADKLTRSLEQQHGLANANVAAMLQQLRTMREAGASTAAQAPLFAAIREQVAQRRDLEQQINQIAGVRTGLAAKELEDERDIANEKLRQQNIATAISRRESSAQTRQQSRAAWNGDGASTSTQGLSAATLMRYSRSVREANFEQVAAARSAGMMAGGLGAVGAGSGRTQMALQQLIFMVDDAATSYGTGGLSGAIRGGANNLTMFASIAGGPWALAAAVALTAASQLYLTFEKTAEAEKTASEAAEDYMESLERQTAAIQKNMDFRRELLKLANQGKSSKTGEEIANRKHELAKLDSERSQLMKEQGSNSAMVSGVQDRGWGEWAASFATKSDAENALRNTELKGRAESLEKLPLIGKRLIEIDQERVRLQSELNQLQVHHEANKYKESLAGNKSKTEQSKENRERKNQLKEDEEFRQKQEAIAEEFKKRRLTMQKSLLEETDPTAAKKLALREELGTRLAEIAAWNPPNRQELEYQAKRSFNERWDQADREKREPTRKIAVEIAKDIDPQKGGRLEALQQAQDRMRELRKQLAATTDPKQQELVRSLQKGTLQSLGKQLLALEKTRPNVANTGTEANTTEGWRAVIAATSGGGKTAEQQMLQSLAKGNELSDQQKRLLTDLLEKFQNSPVIVSSPAS